MARDRRLRVIVTGGRDFNDADTVNGVLNVIHADTPIDRLAEGGALGADLLARKWANASGVPACCFNADWDKHGKAAGPIRNQQMLDEFKPTLVVAFPGGKGTADMVERALKAGVRVRRVEVTDAR